MVAEAKTDMDETISSYLKQPYARVVIPEPDGSFMAEVLEFPGCIAVGQTAGEALSALEEVAVDWLRIALDRGQTIPEPVEASEYSGRFVLRLPKSLHKKAARLAELDGVSLNQFIVAGLAQYVGEQTRAQQTTAQHTISLDITFGQLNTASRGTPEFVNAYGAQTTKGIFRTPRLAPLFSADPSSVFHESR